MSKPPKNPSVTIKPIKLEVYPQELDLIMNQLAEGSFKLVNNLVNKLVAQANDPEMQGEVVPADSKSGESVPQSDGTENAGEAKGPDLKAALAVAAPLLAAALNPQTPKEANDG